jgi:hypothetical protein
MREQRIVTTEVLMHIPIGAGNAHAYGVPFGLSVTFGLDQMFDILSTGFSTTFVLFIYFILWTPTWIDVAKCWSWGCGMLLSLWSASHVTSDSTSHELLKVRRSIQLREFQLYYKSSSSFLAMICCWAGDKNSEFWIALETVIVVATFGAFTCKIMHLYLSVAVIFDIKNQISDDKLIITNTKDEFTIPDRS